MINKENLCVIIPVHKGDISLEEKTSLLACKKHLGRFDCFLVFPAGLDISAYTRAFSSLIPRPVDPSCLSSVEAYNKLKLSLSFYESFEAYHYLLTYELDAYIFHSNFNELNVSVFDFIGAPFFKDYLKASNESPLIDGCNSGFSIRKIKSCIKVLQLLPRYTRHSLMHEKLLSKIPRAGYWLNRITRGRYDIYINGLLGFYFGNMHINEDLVWSRIIPRLFSNFKVADPQSALQFSFEHNPQRLFLLNGNRLPLGCHAWAKYPSFWKEHIDAL